ncbi:hypothetical protein HY643_02945 [Candidatus Woesearchaeota archaeon]|nr:hypothetical protein [Candidatus Woesearchaeota archaeon]
MLETLLTKGREVMEGELGFSPCKSKLTIATNEAFEKIVSERSLPKETIGLFLPRRLQAIVKEGDLNSALPVAIHEYLGHGSFYEQNKFGKILIQHEAKLEQLEQSFLQDKVPIGKRFKLRFSMEKSQITKSDDAFLININVNEQFAQEYLTIIQKLNEEMQTRYHLYEGFAVWLEEFILSKLGATPPTPKTNPADKKFYQMLKDYESKTGPLTLVTKIGFPKNLNDEKKVKLAKENIKDFHNVEFLIAFGSEKEGSDLNLYAIKKEGNEEHFLDENIDISQIKIKQLEMKLGETSDLASVGIIKNGRLIYGDKNEFEKIKRLTAKIGPKAVEHNKKESKELFEYAKKYYEMAIKENTKFYLRMAIIDLAYAISYSQCAALYQNGYPTPLTYKDLTGLPQGKIIKEIRTTAKSNPTPTKTKELLQNWEKKIYAQ